MQIALNSAPPDLAETFLQAVRAEGMPRPQLTASDISSRARSETPPGRAQSSLRRCCRLPGSRPVVLYRLYGYLATPERHSPSESERHGEHQAAWAAGATVCARGSPSKQVRTVNSGNFVHYGLRCVNAFSMTIQIAN